MVNHFNKSNSQKKIVVAMDSFKGSLTSLEAGNAVRDGILERYPDVDVQMPRRLHGVGVEQHARLAADCADLADRQNGADLVVSVHDGNQARILADGALDLLRRHGANGADREQLDGEALFFELLERVQHGVMLKHAGDNVALALCPQPSGGGTDRPVVGLGTAAGKEDLPRFTAQSLRNLLPGKLYIPLGMASQGVNAGGVAVLPGQVGQHCLQHRLGHLSGGGIVRIDDSLFHTQTPLR